MALPTGTITMTDVNIELGLASSSTITLNDSAVRTLAGMPSGTISMNDLRGKSASVPFQTQEFIRSTQAGLYGPTNYINTQSYTITFSGPINDGDFLIVAGIQPNTDNFFTNSLSGFTFLFRHREWSFNSSHRYFSMVVFYRRCNGTEGSNYSVTLPFPTDRASGKRLAAGVRIQGAKNSAITSHFYHASAGGADRVRSTNVPATSASDGVKKEVLFGQMIGGGYSNSFDNTGSILRFFSGIVARNPLNTAGGEGFPIQSVRPAPGAASIASSGAFSVSFYSGSTTGNYYTSQLLRVTMGDNGA